MNERIYVSTLFPEDIRPFTNLISDHGYNVLIGRVVDPDLVRAFQPDALVLDHTRAISVTCREHAPAVRKLPALFLLPSPADPNLVELPEDSGLLMWPASPDEVMFRVRAMFAKSAVTVPIRFRDLVLDTQRKEVRQEGRMVPLTKIEFDILTALLEANGGILSRQEIMDRVWGQDSFLSSNTVDVHIRALRKKLNDAADASRYISTVRGFGYRLAVDAL